MAAGLLTDDEAGEGLQSLREPGRVFVGPLMVSAWGRRPQE